MTNSVQQITATVPLGSSYRKDYEAAAREFSPLRGGNTSKNGQLNRNYKGLDSGLYSPNGGKVQQLYGFASSSYSRQNNNDLLAIQSASPSSPLRGQGSFKLEAVENNEGPHVRSSYNYIDVPRYTQQTPDSMPYQPLMQGS